MFNEGFAERTCSRFTRQFSRCLEDRRESPCFHPQDRMPRITNCVVCCSRENSRFSAYFVFPQSRRRYLRLDLVAKRYWLKIHREYFSVSDRGHKIFSHLPVYVYVYSCCQIQILEYRISPFRSFRFEQTQYSGNFRVDKI